MLSVKLLRFGFHHGIYFLRHRVPAPKEEKLSNDGGRGVLKKKHFSLTSGISDKVLNYVPTSGVDPHRASLHALIVLHNDVPRSLRKPRNFDWYKTVGILWLRTLLHRPEIDGRSLEATSERLRRRITLFSIWVRGDRNEGMIRRPVCLPLNVSFICNFYQ